MLFALHEHAVGFAGPGGGEDGEAAGVGGGAGVGWVVEREFGWVSLLLLVVGFLAVGAEEVEGAEEEGAGSDDCDEGDEEVGDERCEGVVGGGVVAAEEVGDGFHLLGSFPERVGVVLLG